ncbi:ATP-binding cassette domain-containing protein [Rossellomorea aquimaris]|nr:ATP-binding cassette domain-containing protein [Rossellomorea aquimaris]WRP06306.1 ATP-binding cassette domain-containing protein [Rossellomorea aquimaris]
MLALNNLTIKYNQKSILENINISFPRGEVTAIRGASGSGKSSLLNVLGLIQRPNQECSYTLDGQSVHYYNEQDKSNFRLKKVGFVFQQNNLLQELTARENVLVPMRVLSQNESEINEKANELLDYVGLTNVADSYPSDLSGGEEQRVAIARSLINDADIILADEPTASLDSNNAAIVLELFRKLAHEMNKVVIIVSHDNLVAENADTVYEIQEKKLVVTHQSPPDFTSTHKENKVNNDKKDVFNFVRYYIKQRKNDKGISKILIFVTAFIAAITTLFINFGDTFSDQQKDFINSISEKSLFAVNDSLGLNSQTDYQDAITYTTDEINSIKKIPNVNKAYPYYELSSFGVSKNQSDKASLTLKDEDKIIKKETYPNSFESNNEDVQFRVSPLYPEENFEPVLKYKSTKKDSREGVILTSSFAETLKEDSSSLIGKTLEVTLFVPTKLYDSTATKPQDGSQKETSDETVQIDGAIYKLVTITKEITGVLDESFNYQRSEESKNLIFMDYDQLITIINENKDTNYGETFPGFKEKELGPSSLYIDVSSYEDVPIVKSKIEKLSSNIFINSKASDIKEIQTNLEMIKNVMTIVSFILVIIVMLLFGFVYYFKNRTRKKEIGILKALGLTSRDVVFLIGYEMLIIALKTFILSLIIAVALMLLGNTVFGLSGLFVITLGSVIFCFVLSFLIVILSGISSIWKTSRIDIIDAIRKNK